MNDLKEITLRFGNIARLYYDLSGQTPPKQMDLLQTWFPGLIIAEDPSDGNTKIPAAYADREYMIHAVRYHGKLYSGGSTRISQILGRLIGTADGNQEKERKTAELIQKHTADCFITDMELTPVLKENAGKLFEKLSETQQMRMRDYLYELLYSLAEQREETSDYDRKTELFPMNEETFDGTIYNAAYQLNLPTFSGLCNAYLWLLTGSLLRNETGRVLRMYDSSFIAVNRAFSETGKLKDKMDNLFHPEHFYYTYSGDDLENRFPGVEWYCDKCGAHLNEQDGFDDHLHAWQCRACGYVNQLEFEEIHENDEDWKNGIRQVDPERFMDAVARRREELERIKK